MATKRQYINPSFSAPFLKINHRYAVLYHQRIRQDEEARNYIQENRDLEKFVEAYSGEMSKGAVKRLREACELMIAVTGIKWYNHPKTGKRLKFRIGLLTTTLSAKQGLVTAREIKKELLAPYLRKLKKYGLKNYIWKMEKQKNGNVHFHIFVDCFIDRTDARNIWNRLQAKFSYINDFEKKHGHRDPNSTDIKAVISETGLTQYMLKYMLKNSDKKKEKTAEELEEQRKMGKIWDCSTALKLPNDTSDFAEDKELEEMQNLVDDGYLTLLIKDYAVVFLYTDESVWKILPEKPRNRYLDYLSKVKNYVPSDKPS